MKIHHISLFACLSVLMLACAADWPPFDPPPAGTQQWFPAFGGGPAPAPKPVRGIPAFHGVPLLSPPELAAGAVGPTPRGIAPHMFWGAGPAGEELVVGSSGGRVGGIDTHPSFFYYWSGGNYYLSRIRVRVRFEDLGKIRGLLIAKYGAPVRAEGGTPCEEWRAPGAKITLGRGDMADFLFRGDVVYLSDWGDKEYRRRAAWLFKEAVKHPKATPRRSRTRRRSSDRQGCETKAKG